jgi:YVTN family beta-propeller protein
MNDKRRIFCIGLIFTLAFLMSMSITCAEPYAYITNYNSNTVSVIDTATNTVTATVPVGLQPYGVGINPTGTKVYVANSGEITSGGDHTVSVIDTSSNTVTTTVEVGNYPRGVAVNPDGTKVYVTCEDEVDIIDTATNIVTATIPVYGPAGITVTPDGTKVYVANWGGNDVSVIDTATNIVTATVPVGSNPFAVVVNPDGTKAYVTNYASNSVSVIDTSTNTVAATVPVGSYVRGVAVNPEGTKVYVANWIGYDALSVIDTATNTVIDNVPVGSAPWGVSVNPEGTKVYVTNLWSANVAVIDTATNTVTDTVDVGSFPNSLGQFIGPLPKYEGVNLYLSKQAPGSKDHGSSMMYTLYYGNFGNAIAQDVVLIDELPNNVEFESASDNGVYYPSTRTVKWDIGSVDPKGHGYRTLNVSISEDIPVGTTIINNANISTSSLEVRYEDNEAYAQTRVTGSSLPPNVGVEPNNGGSGTISIYWGNQTTYSYDSCDTATGVDIKIHVEDGGSDITGSMTGGPSHWTYTAAPFYPRHGEATITYTVYGCTQSTVSFNIYIDPAGYIYDIDTGERISGASVWLQRPDGAGGWENVPTGESIPVAQPDENPQLTDENGMYQWDVLEGSYRVYVEAPGYEPANSIVVSIPPPVFDLHVGLVHINVAPVADAGESYEGTANVVLTLNGNRSYDPDENRGDSIVSYEWDIDGDGSFNDATGETVEHVWDQAYSGEIGLRVTDSNGAIGTNYTTINIREVAQDLIPPTIQSAILFPANTTAGSTINITATATDNIDVTEMIAGDIQLTEVDGIWQGSITAPEALGNYFLLITAKDETGNIAETSVPYRVVKLSGGANMAVSPRLNYISSSSVNTIPLNITVKNTQNVDDIFRIYLDVSGLSDPYPANLSWFNWSGNEYEVRAGQEIKIPLIATVPAGVTSSKTFYVKVESKLSTYRGFTSGFFKPQ